MVGANRSMAFEIECGNVEGVVFFVCIDDYL